MKTCLEYSTNSLKEKKQSTVWIVGKNLFKFIANLIIIITPFALYQYYAYRKFCNYNDFDDQMPDWCHSSIPISYSHVQSKYWNIGFLAYYQWKQVPNFLLALPILSVIFYSSYLYFKFNWNYLFNIFLLWNNPYQNIANWSVLIRPIINDKQVTRMYQSNEKLIHCKNCLPFVVHSLILALISALFMHVQVSTRFIFASNPWSYWAIYYLGRRQIFGDKTKIIMLIWYSFYFIVGTILFANFYPFT